MGMSDSFVAGRLPHPPPADQHLHLEQLPPVSGVIRRGMNEAQLLEVPRLSSNDRMESIATVGQSAAERQLP
jgi:hypothetical protein